MDDKVKRILTAFIKLLRQEYNEYEPDRDKLKQIYLNIMKKMSSIS